MNCFMKEPLSVHRRYIGPQATYTDAALWLFSDDPLASQAVETVRDEGCVLFIQIGGRSSVLCCAPHKDAPQGIAFSVKNTKKRRGQPGEALMMLYR